MYKLVMKVKLIEIGIKTYFDECFLWNLIVINYNKWKL